MRERILYVKVVWYIWPQKSYKRPNLLQNLPENSGSINLILTNRPRSFQILAW